MQTFIKIIIIRFEQIKIYFHYYIFDAIQYNLSIVYIKKKIFLPKKIVKKKLPKNFKLKDKNLFKNDIKNKIHPSHVYKISSLKINSNGLINLNSSEINFDFLSFSTLSKFVFLKKIILFIKLKIEFFFFIIFLQRKKNI